MFQVVLDDDNNNITKSSLQCAGGLNYNVSQHTYLHTISTWVYSTIALAILHILSYSLVHIFIM